MLVKQKNGYTLHVVKELFIPVGKEVKFTPASLGEDVESITFMTNSEGKKFQSARIMLPDGDLQLQITSEYSSAMLKRSLTIERNFILIKLTLLFLMTFLRARIL